MIDELGINVMVICVQFDEGVILCFGFKVLGIVMEVCDVNMDFFYGLVFVEDLLEVYEWFIFDVLFGEFLLFLVNVEVELVWEIFDLVLEYWVVYGMFDVYEVGIWGLELFLEMLCCIGWEWWWLQ